MAYIYTHTREDTKKIFYVGMSNKDDKSRAFESKGRNVIWHKITNKTNFKVNILIDNITKKEASRLEISIIKRLGKIIEGKGNLSNITNGGDGVLDMPDHMRKKISEKLKGNKNSLGRRWKRTKPCSKEYLNGLSKRMKNNTNASRRVIDTNTGVIYNTVREASIKSNIPLRTLIRWLKGYTKNKSFLKYYEHN